MGLASLLLKNPVMFLMVAVPLLYSIIAHELAHGWVAYLFGDDTAKRSGRLSFNPMRHLDPMGTLALFLVGFGWAKPVPVDFSRLRNFRVGLVAVSLAGCLTNILIATIAIFLIEVIHIPINSNGGAVLYIVAQINIILGALNLIPIPPLDGSKILLGLVPKEAQKALIRIEPYGFMILIFLLITGFLRPVINVVQGFIMLLIRFVLRV